ncbi:MAG TPA: hypothetical protein VFG69_16260, partial [Nannocystaceae bacterium]|nr:hypothetical protein [Nannocystaceae bacterium]
MKRTLVAALALALLPTGASALPRGKLKDDKLPDKEPIGVPGEPGSGMPLAQPPHAPDTKKLAAPLPVRAADEREAKALDELEALAARYKSGHEAMAHTIGQTLLIGGVAGRR